jgi:Bacterial protein of unknown function (DUF924)
MLLALMSSSMVRQKAGASWVDRVQAFWFEELKPSAWFEASAEIDEIIRTRFLTTRRHVAADFDIVAATASADQSVASAIVQFPRTCFEARRLPLQLIISHWPKRGIRGQQSAHRRVRGRCKTTRDLSLWCIVDQGGLMSYGVSLADNYRRAAKFVDRREPWAIMCHREISSTLVPMFLNAPRRKQCASHSSSCCTVRN